MNRDFDFDVRFILDKRERSFHEVYILPFEPGEIAQSGPGEVSREDHSAPFPIGGIKQFEDLIWSKRGDDEAGRIVDIQGALGIAAEGNIDLAGISIWEPDCIPEDPVRDQGFICADPDRVDETGRQNRKEWKSFGR